jgi:hypothetical protein
MLDLDAVDEVCRAPVVGLCCYPSARVHAEFVVAASTAQLVAHVVARKAVRGHQALA